MPPNKHASRRNFLITAVGGGITISTFRKSEAASGLSTEQLPSLNKGEMSIWIEIKKDNSIIVRSTHPETGNGVMTQTAMTIAEELHCDWNDVQVENASIMRDIFNNRPYSRGNKHAFFGGRSTKEEEIDMLLQAGASIRERLKTAAAHQLKVSVKDIEAKDGKLLHIPSGRMLTFGDVAGAAAKVKLRTEPALKPRSEWTVLGKEKPGKLGNALIVTGSAIFGMDVRLPGMVYAALRQAPVHGGKLKSYNADAVKNLPGVLAIVTVDPADTPGLRSGDAGGLVPPENIAAQSAVAVIAEHYWQARKALDALPVEWDDGPGAMWSSIEQINEAAFAACDKPADRVALNTGQADLLAKQASVIEARYVTPYSDQACMEPLNGTALVTADGVELWHPTQHAEQAFWVAAHEAGVSLENVIVHPTQVGGGFGRRVHGDDVRMVVAIARKFQGRPVKVIWSREEMTRQGRYRHMVASKFTAGLDAEGLPQAAVVRAASGPLIYIAGLIDSPYLTKLIPNVRVEIQKIPVHLMVGPYRAPGYHSFVFMVESFVNEMAHAAKRDPLEYRLKLLENWPDKGWSKCLKEVAEKSGWGKKLGKGFAQGVAISNWASESGKPETGTTVAVIATIEAISGQGIKVHSLDVAFDTGSILNEDAAVAQVEGGTIFGYNMAMNERLTVQDGRIVEGNFNDYHIARMAEIPKINVHLGGLSRHHRVSMIGEPPVGPVGPAIANAVFKATGKRLRSTPLRISDLV